jgi:multidrug efflux system membrane fusion protein
MQLGIIKRYKSWLTSAAITLVIALWLFSGQFGEQQNPVVDTNQSSQQSTSQPQQLAGVRVRQQAAELVTRTITVNGRTAPARVVELNAETDGRVESVGVERGERLNKGDIIVELDERDRKARLSQAVATVKQRELEFAAREKLKGDSYVSDAQLQEAAALLESARTELTRAELDISYMVTRAPFDGALQERHVEVGDFVKLGDPIASYVDDRTLVVSASISEFDAHYVAKGNPGSAKLATGEIVEGTIRYVAPVADEATRTFTVELKVDNHAGDYRAGMTAELLIPAETIMAQRISPSLLTLDGEGNLGVKIVNNAGLVEFHRADIALTSSDGIWIAGLPHSAAIITVGQGFVNEGARVDAVSETDVETAVAIKSGSRAN